MGTSVRKKGRKSALKNNHRGRSGDFFQQFALKLLNGMPPLDLLDESNYLTVKDVRRFGDIYIEDLSLGVEVKASDNNNHPRISIKQKRRYEDIQYPLDHFAYMLCLWKNKKRKTLKLRKYLNYNPMSEQKDKGYQIKVMAENIDEVYFLDIAILDRFESIYGLKRGTFPGREKEDHLVLERERHLRPFYRDSHSHLKNLGLNPKKWTLHSYNVNMVTVTKEEDLFGNVRFWRNAIQFPFYTILSPKLHEKFEKRQLPILSKLICETFEE